MLYIIPILFVTYKFIKWIRYSRYLKSIIRVTKFDDILSYASSKGLLNTKKDFLISIYSSINPSVPLEIGNKRIGGVLSQAIYGTSSSYIAFESTKSLIFQCSRSASGLFSSIVSQHYKTVKNLKLTDIANNSIDIVNDEIQFPLEKTFSNFIEHYNTEDPQYMKIFDYLFGRRKIIGQLVEEKAFTSNSNLFTVLSCKFDSTSKALSYRIINLPFQFSESKLEREISKAGFKTQLYGCFLIGFGVSILVYYGVPFVRDYLFKLKLNKTKASTPEEMLRTCAVCYEQSRDIIFIPCNHVLTCNSCSSFITSCPLCRSQISSKRRLIF